MLQMFSKDIQTLYYPIIRYSALINNNLVIWRMKFKDMTADNSCMIIYFNGEGSRSHFYRIDIPINQMRSDGNDQITVWPTVLANLKEFLKQKGIEALMQGPSLGAPSNYSLNFVQGLNQRNKSKVTQKDVDGIVETKMIL